MLALVGLQFHILIVAFFDGKLPANLLQLIKQTRLKFIVYKGIL